MSPIEHTLDVKVSSKNLIPYPYSPLSEKYGITYTNNGDGSITANGISTADASVNLFYTSRIFELPAGVYTFSGCPDGGASNTFELRLLNITDNKIIAVSKPSPTTVIIEEGKKYNVAIVIRNGYTANNLVFKPQLEKGTTATAYAPYMADVSTASVSKYGKNLFDIATPVRLVNCKTSVENNQLSIERSSSIGNQNVYYSLGEFTSFVGKTVTLSIKNDSAYNWTISLVGLTDAASNYGLISLPTGSGIVAESGKQTTLTYTIPETENAHFFGVRMMSNNNTGNNGDIANFTNCQLEVGSVATEYEPYIEPVIYTPGADGTVEGVSAIYPNTTLIASTGAVIDCEYNRDINKAFAELEQKLTNAVISLGGNV